MREVILIMNAFYARSSACILDTFNLNSISEMCAHTFGGRLAVVQFSLFQPHIRFIIITNQWCTTISNSLMSRIQIYYNSNAGRG